MFIDIKHSSVVYYDIVHILVNSSLNWQWHKLAFKYLVRDLSLSRHDVCVYWLPDLLTCVFVVIWTSFTANATVSENTCYSKQTNMLIAFVAYGLRGEGQCGWLEWWHIFCTWYKDGYRVVQKMAQNFLYNLTLPNISRFSELFHCQNQNTITKDPTTRFLCQFTTLWFLKMCCYRSRIVFYCCFKTLILHKVV